ncbi:conserved hypothetical protein [Theileria orientalis strain Shintoku]|uniref:Uncharacterized protein n=1 Tax=Theileria orientalis strain Shintoku TaxID=869250 RepID=J4CCR1_THEOR|nr:conserved hypothetical protein [Theileria orientalis strain Shintoku]PVC50201.1 hypothetical protein MACL_00002451 [Theileria orientalis]BAM39832.1 conserved hypothetical protein [Theileria orientalis strain Shintoku]|eukprot:XP_009690133.1 conserved hypothetical protein [Theileria orientalis strain Shintoku]
MLDLFADDEDEKGEDSKTEPTTETDQKPEEDSTTLDSCRDAVDITSIEALEELAELNPDLLLPYILPLNKKFTTFSYVFIQETHESVHDIFNKEGVQFIHVQMPNTLPSLNKQVETNDHLENGQLVTNTVYQSSKIECLPSGKLGKLRIHKSGKINLHIDGHEFNFTKGSSSTCKQQVCCHLEKNNEFLFLGNFHNRFVVSPDLSDLSANHYT